MGKHSLVLPEGLALDCGQHLAPITVAYETYGTLNAAGDNAIFVPHALTGNAHLASHDKRDEPGWWEAMVGPEKPLDTKRFFVIGMNVLGGCYGTTGPASINPATGKEYAMNFPVITIRDQVRLQRRVLQALGVNRLYAVIGGSMGGMQTLQWGVTYPGLAKKLVAIATCGQTTAQQIAFNEVQRQAIINDPAWQGGSYYGGPGPRNGLAIARMLAIITYKSDLAFTKQFDRDFAGPLPKKKGIGARAANPFYSWDSGFQIESYLHYQGDKLVQRFDANTYLYLTKAMDLYDLGLGFPSYTAALRQITNEVLLVGVDSDFLYPTCQQKELVALLSTNGARANYAEINSLKGHDGFLIEFDQLGRILRDFLQ